LPAASKGASPRGVSSSVRKATGRGKRLSWLLPNVVVAAIGCLAIDDVQTPNGDVEFSREGAPAGDAGVRESSGRCPEQGWTLVRVDGRDQLSAWSAAGLAPSCSAAPHRLTALAPRTRASLSVEVSTRTGQVVEATYSTTDTGADGEAWGEYQAPIDVERLSFGAATSPTEQPFEFAGTILGPFGPVSIAMIGCARVPPNPC
jgi:hypothetical protein